MNSIIRQMETSGLSASEMERFLFRQSYYNKSKKRHEIGRNKQDYRTRQGDYLEKHEGSESQTN